MPDNDDTVRALVPDAVLYGGYEAAVRERAKDLYLTQALKNARAVEVYLKREAREGTPEGGQIPPVPSAATIRRWAREGDWDVEYYAVFGSTLSKTRKRMRADIEAMEQLAVDRTVEILAGAYDDNPHAGALVMKAVEFTARLRGSGTFGNQFGGRVEASVHDLTGDDDETEEDERSPQDEARVMRERMLQEKQGGGS